MRYHFKVHKESSGYWAECLELEGCQTQGSTLAELEKNMEEALNLYLSEPQGSDLLFPFPDPSLVKKKGIKSVRVQPRVCFAMMVRQARLKRKKTQRQMKDLLEIKNLSAYQRFEDPRRANPTLDTIEDLKRKLPELRPELIWT